MKAVALVPRQPGSARCLQIDPPRRRAGQVEVRTLAVGVCGTDQEILAGLYGTAPAGAERLVLGHEACGVVERGGGGFRAGELVVPRVRRPCPERCWNCRAGEPDMCLTGNYRERGIKGLDGFMAERFTEAPEYLVWLARPLRPVAMLLEPLTVVEKGVGQTFRLQRRLRWRPRQALVLGAGPIGLLGAALARSLGLATTVWSKGVAPSREAWLRRIGAAVLDAVAHPLAEVPQRLGNLDLLLECTGAAPVILGALMALGTNGVLCLLGVSGGDRALELPVDRWNLRTVLANQVVVGSVNAHRRDFEAGARHLAAWVRRWPGLLEALVTRQVAPDRFEEAVARRPDDIKTVVRFAE
ncbi:MAG: glucose 1-dehydrogenase [Candidatus Rokubacteria bacterium]|nr:glucose 1-dehydrogenase [Candidatus Rokubacteria bacterium]